MSRAEKRENKNKRNKIIFFLILFAGMFLISAYRIIEWKINSDKNKEILKEIERTVSVEITEEEERIYTVDFETLKEKNSDTIAWIRVNETNIEYPIVKATNNSYYLTYNFKKEYNSGGWVFADYKNKFDGTDKNIVIYGHNMKDGSMFGSLKNILKEEWYNNEENYTIEFMTENEKQKYQVFSIYKIENEDYYIKTSFKNNEFEKYIKIVKDRSIKDFNISVTEEDSVLTLSTCANNNKYRVVLHAKKVN